MILNNRILRIIQKQDRSSHVNDLYKTYNTLPIDKLFKLRILLHAHKIVYRPFTLPKLMQDRNVLNNQIHQHQTRASSNFHRTSYQSTTGNKCSSNLVAIFWNSLPDHIKAINSELSFKKAVMLWQWQDT